MKRSRKIIAVLELTVILASYSLFSGTPPRAYALLCSAIPGIPGAGGVGLVVPVNDAQANSSLNKLSELACAQVEEASVLNTTQFSNLGQILLQWAQTFVLATLKKRLLDMLVDQIIQWIQGGGKPQFVTNFGAFFKSAANAAVGDFLTKIGAAELCSPFAFKLQASLFATAGFGQFPVPKFSEQVKCTLEQVLGNVRNGAHTIQDFFSDFRKGEWAGFNAALEPQNNYIGSLLIGVKGLEQVSSLQSGLAYVESLAGGGFLAAKVCEKDQDGNDIPETCQVTTPGKIAGDLTAKAVGSDIDYIVNTDQLTDYVAAIWDAITNRLIREGQQGLLGIIGQNAPPGGIIAGGPDCRSFTDPTQRAACICSSLPPDLQDSCTWMQQNSDGTWQSLVNVLQQKIARAQDAYAQASNYLTQAINFLSPPPTDYDYIGELGGPPNNTGLVSRLAPFSGTLCPAYNASTTAVDTIYQPALTEFRRMTVLLNGPIFGPQPAPPAPFETGLLDKKRRLDIILNPTGPLSNNWGTAISNLLLPTPIPLPPAQNFFDFTGPGGLMAELLQNQQGNLTLISTIDREFDRFLTANGLSATGAVAFRNIAQQLATIDLPSRRQTVYSGQFVGFLGPVALSAQTNNCGY